MKLPFIFIFIIIFFCTYHTNGQTSQYNPITDPEYPATYKKLKEHYIIKLDSEIHYEVLVLTKKFVDKINHPAKTNALMYIYSDPLKYIKDNFSSTSFESYEEAVAEWEALTEMQLKEMQQNSNYYKIEDFALKKWGAKVLTEVADEIKREYPEKFNLLKN